LQALFKPSKNLINIHLMFFPEIFSHGNTCFISQSLNNYQRGEGENCAIQTQKHF